MWIKSWFNRIRPATDRLETIAQQVAASCQNQVWDRVRSQIGSLTYHEARGYAEARSALVVLNSVQKLDSAATALSPSDLRQVQRLARERVAVWAVGQSAQLRRSHSRSQRRAA